MSGWLSTASSTNEITESVRYETRTVIFLAGTFTRTDTVTQTRWVGMTFDAADNHAQTLSPTDGYKDVQVVHNGAGGYDVQATKIVYGTWVEE